MMWQGWPCQDQRYLLRELDRINWRNGSAGAAKQHQVASGTQALEIFVEGGLPHAVIHDMYTFAVGQPLGLGRAILLRVYDHVVGAAFTCEPGLLVGSGRRRYSRSPVLGRLDQQ